MSHKVIRDFGQGDDPDSLTVTPYWVICVYRQKNPVTYKRSTGKPFTTDMSKAVEIFPKPLIITDDCFSLNVSSTKTNHISNLNASLYATENYMHLINPGDWICAWMVQSETTFKSLIQRIKDKKKCNKFEDGLKFFGKVNSIRKQLQQHAQGQRLARYTLTGTGFSEFDATLYYNPYLVNREDLLATQFGRFGYDINQLIDKERGGITSEKAIPQIVDVLLGKGTPSNLKRTSPDDIKTTYGTEGEYAYILPKEMGQLIGKLDTTKRAGIGYADLIELVVGVQSYGQEEPQPEGEEDEINQETEVSDWIDVAKTFQPKGTESPGSRRFTDTPELLGAFLPTSASFTNRTVWNVLKEYLNPACNEMFTTLRVNPDGDVVPTLVLRQLPFTSSVAQLNISHTKFLSIPRWEIHPILIHTADVGRSDSIRFNFVDVLPISSSAGARNPASLSATFPPRWDGLDIARNGIRAWNQTIPSFAGETRNDSTKDWKDLITDIVMGQHMTLTGNMHCVGIQSPICIGDNLEFDGVVYHIETINHSCSIDLNGSKVFSTSLSLTNGVNATPKSGNDLSVYAYTSGFDANSNQFDPQTTSNSVIEREEHDKRTGLTSDSTNVNEIIAGDGGIDDPENEGGGLGGLFS